jgi:undecaprenyl-diphosphatase
MAAFAFCHSTAKIYKKYRIPLYALAVFMGLSRIYLCMHFPTDVIFGAFFGILFAIASQKIYELIAKGGKHNE